MTRFPCTTSVNFRHPASGPIDEFPSQCRILNNRYTDTSHVRNFQKQTCGKWRSRSGRSPHLSSPGLPLNLEQPISSKPTISARDAGAMCRGVHRSCFIGGSLEPHNVSLCDSWVHDGIMEPTDGQWSWRTATWWTLMMWRW